MSEGSQFSPSCVFQWRKEGYIDYHCGTIAEQYDARLSLYFGVANYIQRTTEKRLDCSTSTEWRILNQEH